MKKREELNNSRTFFINALVDNIGFGTTLDDDLRLEIDDTGLYEIKIWGV